MNTNRIPGLLGAAALAAVPLAAARADVLFAAHGTGALTIVPVDATTLHETIDMSFNTDQGPTLDLGVLSTLIDLTATSVPTELFDAHFLLTGPGGNSLFGTYSLLTSVFSTPTHEAFSGVFVATGGTGAYAYDYGSGTFSGINNYSSPSLPSAVTHMSVQGDLRVPEPPAVLLFGPALAGLALVRSRRGVAAWLAG